MKKSIKVHPKKRRGRPATGKDPLVSARLPVKLIETIESIAESEKTSRSDAIRNLIERGLQAWVEEQRSNSRPSAGWSRSG
jgi:Arc/MetJ-type ribon-helix-helix transcriptional regulator